MDNRRKAQIVFTEVLNHLTILNECQLVNCEPVLIDGDTTINTVRVFPILHGV